MLDSSIGYASGALGDPAYGDSLIGFVIGTLVDSQMVGVAYLAAVDWGQDP